MQIDIITYLSIISNTIYATVCLLCGLQLCFGIFSQRRHANTLLSRILGSSLLIMFASSLCYLLSDMLSSFDFIYLIGTSIDIFVFTGYTMLGYALYTNNEPSKPKLIALASPFALCAILSIGFPKWLAVLFFVAAVILFAYYIWFGIAVQRREHLLGDLYSDPELHSLQWIWTAIGLFVGWWIVSGLFQLVPSLQPWYNAAIFAYMTILILFVFAKVSNYKEPVSLQTLQEMENDNDLQPATCNLQPAIVARLNSLMTSEQIYLRPDLTIEDVALRLNTNPKYLSAVLNNEMHTTFTKFINHYRIEHAKHLLQTTDDKIEYIASVCGYNSRQVFIHAFTTLTGQTPSEWRK